MLEVAPTLESAPLADLNAGEREVCELLLQRYTTKQIARYLGLSAIGVDYRIRTAREKLGAADRNDLARIYGAFKGDYGKTIVTPSIVADSPVPPVAAASETAPKSAFVFHDAASFTLPPPWHGSEPAGLPEVLDRRFGKMWRPAVMLLGAIGGAAVMFGLLMAASLTFGTLY